MIKKLDTSIKKSNLARLSSSSHLKPNKESSDLNQTV